MDRDLIAWAAGIYEGEGCVGTYPRPMASNTAIRIQVAMSDGDIVARWGAAVGCGSMHGPYFRKHFKPTYVWAISGHENCQYVIAMLWRWLGVRRRAQAAEMLARYRAVRPNPPHRGTKTHCVRGHERTPENTYTYVAKTGPRRGRTMKYCIPCNQESCRGYRSRVAAA